MTVRTIALILLLTIGGGAVAQDAGPGFVRASRTAVVREAADADARELARLQPGEELNLAAADPDGRNWYRVFLADGRVGFVSRFRVRRFEGATSQVVGPPPAPGAGGGLSQQEQAFAAFHFAVAGQPKAYREFIRDGYAVGYDPARKIPVWVQYRLTEARSENDEFPRPSSFQDDGEVQDVGRAFDDDYDASGHDRGHMAPADDMRFDETVVKQSNLLTNIAPQEGDGFNNSVWKRLENRVRTWVKDRDDLTIIVGPIFRAQDAVPATRDPRGQDVDENPLPRQPVTERQMLHNVIGAGDVAVPTHFFKIVADLRDPANPVVLAFIMPHYATETEDERTIGNYLRSVDDVERATGIDFLAGLPDPIEERVEREAAEQIW